MNRVSGRVATALALAVVTMLVTGAVIGSDLRGCPRTIDRTTCFEE